MRLHGSLIRAAESGASQAMRHFRRGVAPDRKGARDLVTAADRSSEEAIIRTLRRDFLGASFLAEESGAHGGTSEIRFVIDPLDATTNFVLGLPDWSVMIAAYHQEALTAAVVFLPIHEEMFGARLGEGSFRNHQKIHVAAVAGLDDAAISLNRSNFPPSLVPGATAAFNRIISRCFSIRDLGTAGVEYVRVAEGALSGVVTPLAEAVHAAGYLVMSEAGAIVTDQAGAPIGPDSKTLVAANPTLHPKLLALLNGIDFNLSAPAQ